MSSYKSSTSLSNPETVDDDDEVDEEQEDDGEDDGEDGNSRTGRTTFNVFGAERVDAVAEDCDDFDVTNVDEGEYDDDEDRRCGADDDDNDNPFFKAS